MTWLELLLELWNFIWEILDEVWSILPALELLPLELLEQSMESNTNAGKMDQTWSREMLTKKLPHW